MSSILANLDQKLIVMLLISFFAGSTLTAGAMFAVGAFNQGETQPDPLDGQSSLLDEIDSLGMDMNSRFNDLNNLLGVNDIDPTGTLSSTLTDIEDDVRQIRDMLGGQDDFNIDPLLRNMSAQHMDLLSRLDEISAKLDSMLDLLMAVFDDTQYIRNNIDGLGSLFSDLSSQMSDLQNSLDDIMTGFRNLSSVLTDLSDIIDELEFVLSNLKDTVQNIEDMLQDVLDMLRDIINMLRNLNAKLQKNVQIDMDYRRFDSGAPMAQIYVLASLEGEGGLPNTRLTNVMVVGQPDVPITVRSTDVPGYFEVDIDKTALPPGEYQVIVEVEIDLPLPDGSTETFKGRAIMTIYNF